jgi:cation diffusion facilitator family transporter
MKPVLIAYDQAILVAVLGLIVNGISVVILRDRQPHHEGTASHRHDHNLLAAYLHVLADALTSLLAIAALLAAKYVGWTWMDPAMGILGGLLVARWSWGLVRGTSRVLVDLQAPDSVLEEIRGAVDDHSGQILDLHVWEIGPGYRAAILAVESDSNLTPSEVKEMLPEGLGIIHSTVEIHQRRGRPDQEEKESAS